MKTGTAEKRFKELEGASEKLKDQTAWLLVCSAEENARATWEEKGREDRFSEEYYEFAFLSLESLLSLDSTATPKVKAWFSKKGFVW